MKSHLSKIEFSCPFSLLSGLTITCRPRHGPHLRHRYCWVRLFDDPALRSGLQGSRRPVALCGVIKALLTYDRSYSPLTFCVFLAVLFAVYLSCVLAKQKTTKLSEFDCQQSEVRSNLMLYAQSTSMVISGWSAISSKIKTYTKEKKEKNWPST